MSTNPDDDGRVSSPPSPGGFEAEQAVLAPAEAFPVAPQSELDQAVPIEAPATQVGVGEPPAALAPALPEPHQAWIAPEPAYKPERTRSRRGWMAPVAVGVVGIIATGTLGYFLYATAAQRDSALRQVTSDQATLTATRATLTTAQDDLTARKDIAAYTSMFIADRGRAGIDYQKLEACTTFGTCRTAAQSMLTEMQAFQSDRSSANAPAALANSDAMLRDAISAAIAADQELISGLDSGNSNKIKDGFHKVNAAMLSMAKAESVLGAELR